MKDSGGTKNFESGNALGEKTSVARELVRLPVIVAACSATPCEQPRTRKERAEINQKLIWVFTDQTLSGR